MPSYRMQAYATICFDVKADSIEEAEQKAREMLSAHSDGISLPEVGAWAVAYPESEEVEVIHFEGEENETTSEDEAG